jgi:hypothetical protein
MSNMGEDKECGVVVENTCQEEYKGMLVQGTPMKPTVQQIDALVSLLIQIAQRTNKEEMKNV